MKSFRRNKVIRSIAVVSGLTLAVFALSGPAFAQAGPRLGSYQSGAGAVFVQTDNLSGNQILSYQRGWNGQLTAAGTYNTGGDGSVAVGSAVDPLASQGSVMLADQGRVLLVVNAGSDTVSVFLVFGTRLVLTDVVPSGGSTPSSIAVHGSLVYVLNSGGAGSIQGFVLFGWGLWPLPGSNRSLGLGNTTPPFFLDAPGQVGFTPSGQQLIVTTKNSGSDIDVFSIGHFGMPSAEPVVNAAADPIPFAFTFDPEGHLVVTEAGASALTAYTVNADGTVTALGTAGDGQAALCWVTADDGYFYGSNAGTANVSQFSVSASGLPQLVGAPSSTPSGGATDSAASPGGQFLYVEQGGAGTIYEFQVGAGGSLTQIGEVSGLAAPMEGIAAS